ncbi:MAG: AAA family ATPase [Chloroflexi bacterium]|nr:AAA family ATPase [Chloroflexota bacterium]
MQPTREQSDAIHIQDKNLLVVAGAGSGKTRVLVARYIQLLADNPTWPIGALVAITFTRAAAFEMRQRLREELEQQAGSADGEQWARHLAALDSARIDTIHGLCADILRANAAQAGVDPKFVVLDEIEAAILLDEVVADELATLDLPLVQLYAIYDAWRIEDESKRMSLVSGANLAEELDSDALFWRWQAQWAALVDDERRRLLASREAAAVEIIDYPTVNDALADLLRMYRDQQWRLRKEEPQAEDIVAILQTWHKEGVVGNKGTAAAWGGKEEKKEVAQAMRALRDRVKEALDSIGEPPGEIDRRTAQVLPLWRKLLSRVRDAYRQRKAADARLDFDDLERLAAELLGDPAVRRRYRNAEFKHLLVDEFQDTNAAQWRIIRSLADLNCGGTLFAVGDPKQSIYQFRGADISVFNRVRARILQLEACRALPLSMSFRSHSALVALFNALFARILVPEPDNPAHAYEVAFDAGMRAFRDEPPAAPALELQLLDAGMRDESGAYIRGKRGIRKYPADDMRRWEAWEIADRVQSMIAVARPVYDKDSRRWRPIDYRDVTLLFQSMSNVTLYEEVFKSRGIPYLTVAGRGYYDRQEVWDVLDLLRCLHNPADDLSLASALRSPLFAFSDDLLFALRLLRDDAGETLPLWRALHIAADAGAPGLVDDCPALEFALEVLTDLRRLSGRITISELLRLALAKTNYLAVLTGLPDGARRRGNVEKLEQLAEASGKITLGKFTQYLDDLTSREAREGEALLEAGNALRLMTVHASKGLEFPLVILADTSWARGAGGAPLLLADPEHGLSCQLYDAATNKNESGFAHKRNANLQKLKEAAERKRLLYVAATRAQDYLLISGQVKRNREGRWTSRGWLSDLLEALELQDIEGHPQQTCQYASQPVAVLMPPAPPPPDLLYHSANIADDLWDFEADPRDYPPLQPLLLGPLPPPPAPAVTHITATQIAQLGAFRHGLSARQRLIAGRRFRASVMGGLPPDASAALSGGNRASPAVIGAIVHELLRYGNFALDTPGSDEMIRSVAWEKGLTNPQLEAPVQQEVRRLLERYADSDVCRWIRSARQQGRAVHTELAFLFRTDKRVIHGVMDVLLEGHDGEWLIIDYKTSQVIADAYEAHARRYRLQLGVYAAAAQKQLGLERPPQTCVHYIRGNRTVMLASEDCRAELDALETAIGALAALDD